MDLSDAAEFAVQNGGASIYETSELGVKLGVKPAASSEGHEAQRLFAAEYEDPLVELYEVCEEYEGTRRREEVGRVIDESEVPKLAQVVGVIDDIPLDTAECRECVQQHQSDA